MGHQLEIDFGEATGTEGVPVPPQGRLSLREQLDRMSPEQRERYGRLPELRVWYGLRKLTQKAVRRRSICAIYENFRLRGNGLRAARMLHLFHERPQPPLEKTDAVCETRILSIYERTIDRGGTEKAVRDFLDGERAVPVEEVRIIEGKLREKIRELGY